MSKQEKELRNLVRRYGQILTYGATNGLYFRAWRKARWVANLFNTTTEMVIEEVRQLYADENN